jgi:hypothetical protein
MQRYSPDVNNVACILHFRDFPQFLLSDENGKSTVNEPSDQSAILMSTHKISAFDHDDNIVPMEPIIPRKAATIKSVRVTQSKEATQNMAIITIVPTVESPEQLALISQYIYKLQDRRVNIAVGYVENADSEIEISATKFYYGTNNTSGNVDIIGDVYVPNPNYNFLPFYTGFICIAAARANTPAWSMGPIVSSDPSGDKRNFPANGRPWRDGGWSIATGWSRNINSLCNIFDGYVDTISLEYATNGVQFTLSLRDGIRIFKDTTLISLGGITSGSTKFVNSTDLLRQIVRDTADASRRFNYDGHGIFASVPVGGLSYASYKYNGKNLKYHTPTTTSLSFYMMMLSHIVGPDNPGVRYGSNSIDFYSEPGKFFGYRHQLGNTHIFSFRPPFEDLDSQSLFKSYDSTAYDVIQFLLQREELPVDFWQSPFNGAFIIGPRAMSIYPLVWIKNKEYTDWLDNIPNKMVSKPLYNLREYILPAFKDALLAADPSRKYTEANFILEGREIISPLDSKNRFVITSDNVAGSKKDLLANILYNFDVDRETLDTPHAFPRSFIWTDKGITRTGLSDEAAAVILATLLARKFTSEAAAIHIKVMGDPTILPGQAIKVHNPLLHQSVKAKGKLANLQQVKAIPSPSPSTGKASFTIDQNALVSGLNNLGAGYIKDTLNDSYVYNVRTVQHNISAVGAEGMLGYTTELEATIDY